MNPISENVVQATQAFLREGTLIAWLRRAGMPSNAATVGEALDSDKRVWERNTCSIEKEALSKIGDSSVDWIFDATSEALQSVLYDAAVAYFERRKASNPAYDVSGVDAGLIGEMMDCVKRDIAWAAVETVLQQSGFFSSLLSHYRDGRWPYSWTGEYPAGHVVVL